MSRVVPGRGKLASFLGQSHGKTASDLLGLAPLESARTCTDAFSPAGHKGSPFSTARRESREAPGLALSEDAAYVNGMRMTVLASGSKGNSAVVSTERTRILVDAGLSCRELFRRLAVAGEDPARLSAILITHEHQDHVAGLGVLARRLRIPVFFTEPTHRAWVRMLTPRTTMTYAQWLDRLAIEKAEKDRALAAQAAIPTYTPLAGASTNDGGGSGTEDATDRTPELEAIAALSAEAASFDPILNAPLNAGNLEEGDLSEAPDEPYELTSANGGQTSAKPGVAPAKIDPTYLPAVEYFHSGTGFTIGDIDVCPFTIPHDAADPCGFVFSNMGIRFGLATDLGYMPPNVKSALRNVDLLLLESNHDLEMLKDGPYPWSVKQRVLSRVGHLSNLAAAEFLERDYDGGAHTIVLGHLSEANNLPELARLAAEQAIGNRMTLLGNRVVLAVQDTPLDPICL